MFPANSAFFRWCYRAAPVVLPLGLVALVGLHYASTHAPSVDVATTSTTSSVTTTTVNGVPSKVTRTTTVTTHSKSAKVSVTGTPAQEKLFAALPQPPSGAMPWKGVKGPLGIISPDRFLAAWADAGTGTPLSWAAQHDGLDYAVRVAWSARDGAEADDFAVHFGTSAGAHGFYESLLQAGRTDLADDATGPAAVPGVADGRIFAKKGPDPSGDATVWGFDLEGDVVVADVVLTPDAPDRASVATMIGQEHAALQ